MTEKITHNPTQSWKEMENRKESLRDPEDVLRCSNISLIGVLGGKNRENGGKASLGISRIEGKYESSVSESTEILEQATQ